jgi:hypothetical protein
MLPLQSSVEDDQLTITVIEERLGQAHLYAIPAQYGWTSRSHTGSVVDSSQKVSTSLGT